MNIKNILTTIIHAVAQGIVWFAPLAILQIPASIGTMTVSGVLSAIVAYIAHNYVSTN
jgi:hypothetical protein